MTFALAWRTPELPGALTIFIGCWWCDPRRIQPTVSPVGSSAPATKRQTRRLARHFPQSLDENSSGGCWLLPAPMERTYLPKPRMEVLQSSHDQVRSLGAEVTQVGTPPALYSFMYNFSYRDSCQVLLQWIIAKVAIFQFSSFSDAARSLYTKHMSPVRVWNDAYQTNRKAIAETALHDCVSLNVEHPVCVGPGTVEIYLSSPNYYTII